MRTSIFRVTLLATSFAILAAPMYAKDGDKLTNPKMVASTVPSNGDVNPYGVAIVPVSRGKLVEGQILVSNFNNSGNLQGTGTTIVQVDPNGKVSLFATITAASLPGSCPGGVGLTTALVALRSGFVIVGSLPTTDGTPATIGAGCLIVLDSNGNPVSTITGAEINGPWDMTALDLDYAAVLFVSNVLNGSVLTVNGATVPNGSVLRLVLITPSGFTPHEVSRTVIASAFGEHTDPAALIVGPTGLGLGANGTLFVADTVASRIAAIANALFRQNDAGVGDTVSAGGALNNPLGLAITGNGSILTVNGGDGNAVEITPQGKQVAVTGIDVSDQGGGTLFGLAISGNKVYYVDDGNNTLDVVH